VSETKCAACGLPGHRFGRNEGVERYDPIACINMLRGEIERLEDENRLWRGQLLDAVRQLTQ
jgi:hypothetical protein